MKTSSLRVWRDSVHPGDDFDAPHELRFKVDEGDPLSKVVAGLLEMQYLPGISGGKATWILRGKQPLAVFAQQRATPRYLVAPETTVTSYIGASDKCDLEFLYWCQVDPDLVYECIHTGKELPDKHGA
jgi:hypothetical protein